VAEFIGALAWAGTGAFTITGLAALVAGHFRFPRQHPKPRYRRTRADFG